MSVRSIIPPLEKPFAEWPNVLLLSALVWGEARGEPDIGKLAVAEVAKNRVSRPAWWGSSWKGVILKPYQFSCFNPGDPSLISLKGLEKAKPGDKILGLWCSCVRAASFVYHATEWKPQFGVARGADHYHAASVKPSWSVRREPCVALYNHLFYCLGPSGGEDRV